VGVGGVSLAVWVMQVMTGSVGGGGGGGSVKASPVGGQ
jgi:hypothetical protein